MSGCHDGQYQTVRHAWSAKAGRWVCPGERVVIVTEFGTTEPGTLVSFVSNNYRLDTAHGLRVIDWNVVRDVIPA